MTLVYELVICAFLLVGGVFCVSGSIGLMRFPDIYCKLQAISKPVTLGISCLIVAYIVFLFYTGNSISLKGILAIAFLIMSVPIGIHMIVKAAYRNGVPLWEHSLLDELSGYREYEDDLD